MATESIESALVGAQATPANIPAADFVTVVLPCLNEENSVGLVVMEALDTLHKAGLPGEVLVVDNGSTDRSAELARAAGARVIREDRPGYGRALRTGIAAASGTIVVMADADWTYDLTKIPLLVEPIREGAADIAIGSRLRGATRQTMPVLHRYVGTPALTALVRQAGGYSQLPDSQSGFRCFRKEAISALNLRSDGMEFASEMLIKSSRRRLRLVDIPIDYRRRIGTSKLNTFADGWRHLRLILLLAPEILFLAPGALLFLVGVVLSAAAFLPTRGIQVGSLRWQPIFFASIALVLGLQAVLVGLIFVWRRAARSGAPLGQGLGFIRTSRFPQLCLLLGAALLVSGLGINGLLFGQWIDSGRSASGNLPLASLAQSLLLVGGSLGSFGLVVLWLHWDDRQNGD
jgi:glycosyltransferase involved in cell wall biosynthesis